jgi:hypothetical protein
LTAVSAFALLFTGWLLGILTIYLGFWMGRKTKIPENSPKLFDPGPQPTTIGDDPFEEAKKGIKTIDETRT